MSYKCRVIYDNSEETKMRENARMREKQLHDEASALKGAKMECKAEEREYIISLMRSSGMADERINAIITGKG